MSPFVASGKELSAHVSSFLGEVGPLVESNLKVLATSKSFRDVYKVAVAADTILEALDDPKLRPGLSGLRAITLRIPALVALGQASVASVELRRFLEVTAWTVFFTHHPIEWQDFEGRRGTGFARDQRKPISFAAHRDLNAYLEYAYEYMELEGSKHAVKALKNLENDKPKLHAAAHAGDVARTPMTVVPIEVVSEARLKVFASLQKRVSTECLILLAAFSRERYEGMAAPARAYWQWLLGNERQKSIRSVSDFGIYL